MPAASDGSAATMECGSDWRASRTGHDAVRTTLSATLPSMVRASSVRPCVLITMRSVSSTSAASTMPAGTPSTLRASPRGKATFDAGLPSSGTSIRVNMDHLKDLTHGANMSCGGAASLSQGCYQRDAGREHDDRRAPTEEVQPATVGPRAHDATIVRNHHDQREQWRSDKTVQYSCPEECVDWIDTQKVEQHPEHGAAHDNGVETGRFARFAIKAGFPATCIRNGVGRRPGQDGYRQKAAANETRRQ